MSGTSGDEILPLEEKVTDPLAYALARKGIRAADKIPMAARLYPDSWHNYTTFWEKLAATARQHLRENPDDL